LGIGFRRLPSGARGVLMGPHARAVNPDDGPDQFARSIGSTLQRVQHPFPDALSAPAHQPVVAGLPGAV